VKRVIGVVFFYTLISAFMTYPLVLRLNSGVYGYSGDNFGLLWHLWWQKQAVLRGVTFSPSPMVGAPFGTVISALPGEPGWSYPIIWLTNLFNETLAFNLLVFLSFPLAALTMYLLSFYVTKNTWASLVAGLIYAFCPFHFWQIYVHFGLGNIQWLPLFVLGLLHFERVRGAQPPPRLLAKAALLWGLAWGWVFLNSVYFGYFSLLLAGAYYFSKLIFRLIFERQQGLLPRPALMRLGGGLAVAAVVALLLALPGLWPMMREQAGKEVAGQTVARPIEHMLSMSARPWDFLLPAPDQPRLGEWSDSVYIRIRSLSNDYKTISAFLPERVVFLGWLPLLLAILGLVRGSKSDRYRSLTFIFSLSSLILLLVSAPPFVYIKGFKLLLPSYFLYQVLPMFRVYVRLGILLQLLVALLASVGLTMWLSRLSGRRSLILAVVLGALVLGEFNNLPPSKVTPTTALPESYRWLSQQEGDFIVAEYPKAYDTQDALFWQRFHGKKVFNTLGEPDYYRVWDQIEHLYYPEAPQILANLGVRYVVWHYQDPVYNGFSPVDETRWQKFLEPEVKTDLPGLAIRERLSDAYVYEVTVPPQSTPELAREKVVASQSR